MSKLPRPLLYAGLALAVIFLVAACSKPVHAASPENWDKSSWPYRKQIVIDSRQVENENFVNFPVLVNWSSDAELAAHVGKDNGDDILFTSSDGTTKLNHEIENFDRGSGQLVAWVKIPILYDNADTVIYLYYGNAAATNQENRTGTWDDNYAGVWHLPMSENVAGTGNSGVYKDSTANANHGGDNTSATGKTGQIGGGQEFDGTYDNIVVPHSNSFDISTTVTWSVWFRADALPASIAVLMRKAGGEEAKSFTLRSTGQVGFYLHLSGGVPWLDGAPMLSRSTCSTNTWYYAAVTYDGTTAGIYLNGDLEISRSVSGDVADSTQALTFGGDLVVRYPFDGHLDEIRISNVARSASWIKTEFNNQNSPGTFYSLGAEEATTPFKALGKPVLSSPADEGSYVVGQDVTFTWTVGENSENSRIEVATDAGFTSVVDNQTIAVPTASYTKTGGYAPGTYYWRVWAENRDLPVGENVSANTNSFTINAAPTGTNILVGNPTAGSTAQADFSSFQYWVTIVTASFKSDTPSAIISGKQAPLAELPDETNPPPIPPGAVYKDYWVVYTNFSESSVDYATLDFRIDRAWVTDYGVDEQTIKLYRYEGAWVALPTDYLGSDGSYFYYRATSPGLSFFVARGEQRAPTHVTPTPAPPQEPQVQPVVVPDGFYALLAIAGAIAALAIVYSLARPSRYYYVLKQLARAVARPRRRREESPSAATAAVRKRTSAAELAGLRRLRRVVRSRRRKAARGKTENP